MSRPRPSRSHSRVPLSRAHSQASSIIFLPGGADALILPDGPIGAPAAERLGEIINPQRHETEATSSTLLGDASDEPGRKKSIVDGDPAEVNHDESVEDNEEEIQEQEERMKRPWYRRPSPWWVLVTMFTAAIAGTTTIAPRVEVYTKLACQALRPEYTVEILSSEWNVTNASGTLPPPSKLCGKDPDVQAAVAKLMTIMTVSMGLLSCLTTGWWGQLSDRYGRTRILGIAVLGILATDVNFIMVSLASDRLPGGYRFLLVGPVLDGLLGGMPTLIASLHAYVSDCTPAETRSRIFSLNLGLLFGGMALGPTLGGLMVRATNNLLSVFYFATASHLFYACMIWFLIPESLTKASMRKARKRRETRNDEDAAAELAVRREHKFAIRARIWSFLKMLFGFLAPLGIFLPSKRPEGRGWNWNLTLLVFSYVCAGLLMGSYQFKFQYAQRAFGWDSESMGYWLSVVSVVRALHLIVILPLILKFITPKAAPIQLPVSPVEPLHAAQSSSDANSSPERSSMSRRSEMLKARKHSPTFDVALARVSLGIELVSYIGMALALSSWSWTGATLLGAFGGGFSPALQSVALALYEQGPNRGIETGRLFGGLSVVQALSTQIVGPSLFGFTYVSTVNTFPKGIFVVAGGAVACSLFFMSLVRLSSPKVGHDQEETAVESEDTSES